MLLLIMLSFVAIIIITIEIWQNKEEKQNLKLGALLELFYLYLR